MRDMGNILRRGIDAYQQTMTPKPAASDVREPPNPAPQKNPPVQKKNEGLVKTIRTPPRKETLRVPRPGSVLPADEGGEDSKYRRVAKFLILVGGDQAAGILAELENEQVEAISREIASIRGISAGEGEAILAEFRSLFSMPYSFSGAASGGVETARRILYAALGPEKGESLLNKAVPDSKENIFDFLEEFTPEQLLVLLKDEAPSTAALILSRVSSRLSAGTVNKLSAERKPEIVRRIAHQGEVAPEVLERVAAAVKEKARHIGGTGAKELKIDGMQALAAILKQGDYSFGDRIISELETNSPGVGRDLKERLYTLDDVVNMIDRPLQEKLKTMSDQEIAVLLKGRGIEFREKILSCVSAGRRALIREEGEILGAVPRRDCDEAASAFLGWFRLSREKGEIILSSDEDVFV
jgi:flagellar motor switch protein FliG